MIIDFLSGDAPSGTIIRIMSKPVPKSFKTGQALFKEGEPSKSIFIIKKGSVGIRKIKGSAFVEIARVYTNEVLGELSFFDRLPRSASAVALTDVEALEITFNDLDKVYATVPDYMKTIIAALAERLRKANDTIRRLQKNIVPGETTEGEGKEGAKKEGKETGEKKGEGAAADEVSFASGTAMSEESKVEPAQAGVAKPEEKPAAASVDKGDKKS